ncbi:hypothetical protein Ancab_022165, partial [Ancistrocladus abbreviatus]
WTAEASVHSDVSFSLKQPGAAFMKAETGSIKRREKQVTIIPFNVSSSTGNSREVKSDILGCASSGPSKIRPILSSGKGGLADYV